MTHTKKTALGKFILPSLLGVVLLMVPFNFEGETTILVALLADKLQGLLGNIIPTLVLIMLYVSFGLASLYKFFKPKFIENSPFLKRAAALTNFWYGVRVLAVILGTIIYFSLETTYIGHEETGQMIMFDLIGGLFIIFFFAGFLLPFLTDFGLLEFLGVYLTPVMRPLFGLPGRSAIDCVASWVGDGTIGVSLTSRQYEEGYYSAKEAAVIATCFSAVSITFCIVILDTVGLLKYLGVFYLTVCVVGLANAFILPCIYPLNKKPNSYYTGENKNKTEDLPADQGKLDYALKLATAKAEENFSLKKLVKQGLTTALDMWLSVLPSIITFGTLALMLATFTPIFSWIGLPFRPILNILQVPEYQIASDTMLVGFADMFLPAMIAQGIQSDMTRFIIATVSITQVLFMSETGAVILGSKIPVNLKDLFVIFIERTLISLPIVSLIAHLIF